MTAKTPRTKWISKSAHPKEAKRHYPGPGPDTLMRDGKVTHVNLKAGPCVQCGDPVAEREGWLLILPFRNGPGGKSFAVMCRGCGGAPDAPEGPP